MTLTWSIKNKILIIQKEKENIFPQKGIAELGTTSRLHSNKYSMRVPELNDAVFPLHI